MLQKDGSYTEKPLELPMATTWQPNGNQVATQYSIGKDSIGEYRVVEVSGDDNHGNEEISTDLSTFELQKGTLGRGVVLLTPEQDEALLEKLGFDGYNHYVSKLAAFIIDKNATVANHYATILKWAKEDAKV